jgi:two-component system cell cycle response regulator
VLVDIDDFRDLNTRYGHRAGDEVLLEVTHRIEAVMRRSDVAVRYGSEEFALLLPNTEEQQGGPLIERIRDAVAAAPFDIGVAEDVAVSVSIGVAAHRPGSGAIDPRLAGSELLARAQLALYESQAQRKRSVGGVRLE